LLGDAKRLLGDTGGGQPRGVRARRGGEPYSDAILANRTIGISVGWEMSSRGRYATPADFPLYTSVARTERYTHASKVWDSSLVEGLVSVVPNPEGLGLGTLNPDPHPSDEFATFSQQVSALAAQANAEAAAAHAAAESAVVRTRFSPIAFQGPE
jgi:hypothetical protein